MAINDDQLQSAEDSFESFKAAMGEAYEPYSTEAVGYVNAKTLASWGVEHIGLNASSQLGFWDLAFRNCLAAGTLKRDPNWISRAERNAQLQKEFDALPAEEARRRYLTPGDQDREFKRFVDSIQGGL